jgi:hypothetical protein
MTTPENIEKLEPNEIFVFGSNLAGNHAGGAAWLAFQKFGAVRGQGQGMAGQTYALPTLDENMRPLILDEYVNVVKTFPKYVREFKDTARRLPALTFYLTKVGCGIAGFSEDEIKPFFADCPENVVKPEGW